MGTSSKKKLGDSKYTDIVKKVKFRILCNMCNRMRRRFVKVLENKGVSVYICVNCYDKVNKGKK